METLDFNTRLAERMITSNPDVTIGDFWKLIKEDEPVMVVSSETPIKLPKRYYPANRGKRNEVLEDPAPYSRPLAKYDNRSHEEILDKYAPIK